VERVDLGGVTAVATGGTHNLVLKTDGTVWAWGDNSHSDLGDGSVGTGRHTAVARLGLRWQREGYVQAPLHVAGMNGRPMTWPSLRLSWSCFASRLTSDSKSRRRNLGSIVPVIIASLSKVAPSYKALQATTHRGMRRKRAHHSWKNGSWGRVWRISSRVISSLQEKSPMTALYGTLPYPT
jgi:hypothetical protein